jgi:hypothetical protein
MRTIFQTLMGLEKGVKGDGRTNQVSLYIIVVLRFHSLLIQGKVFLEMFFSLRNDIGNRG